MFRLSQSAVTGHGGSAGADATRTHLRVPSVISFLSFLDILFATVGVFIVVLTVQLLALKDQAPVSADTLIVLKARGEHFWYRGAGSPIPIRQERLDEALDLVTELAASLRRPLRVGVAFSYDAANRSIAFEDLVRTKWSSEPQQASAAGPVPGSGVPWVRLAWRPLESMDADGADLAKRIFQPRDRRQPR